MPDAGAFGVLTPQEQADIPPNLVDRLVALLGNKAATAVMAPGNALRSTPSNPVTTGDMIEPVADLAQLMIGTPGGAGGVGSGARLSFSERMAQGKDLAMERANRGQASGNYGMGGRRQAPDAARGSVDRLAAEQRAGWQGDKSAALDQYREATGIAPEQNALLAPGETMDDLARGFDTLFSGCNKKAGAIAAENTGKRETTDDLANTFDRAFGARQ